MKNALKKTLSVLLCIILLVSCFALSIPSANAAEATAGKYYIKIVADVTDTCQGWTSSSITFTYKSDNGTSTNNTSDAFTSTADSIWNTKGEHVIFEGSYAGFPTSYSHTYNFGGGMTWRGLGYKLTIYAGSSSSNLKSVYTNTYSAKSSAFSAAKGTFAGTVAESNYPLPTSCVFTSGSSSVTIPRSDQAAANVTYNATVKDQYGVAWYIDPIYSLEEAHDGVSFINNTMSVTQEANSANGSNQTIAVTAALRTATATMNVTLVNASYTYKFLNADGGIYTSGTLRYGQQIPVPTNPIKVYDDTYHYLFDSWSGVAGTISKDVVYTPKFNKEVHSFVNYVADGNATCLKDGTKTAVCVGCAKTDTLADVGSALNHTYVATVTTEPTCTEAGLRTYTCSRGDDSYTEVIDALGHDMSEWTEKVAPTCTAAGEDVKTCSRCDYTETKTIDALGHDMSEWIVSTEPTCTEKGEKTSSCSRCDYVEKQEIPALGHSYSDWEVIKEATCTETGSKSSTCTICHESIIQDIPAIGHDYSDWVTVMDPTCTEVGTQSRTCARCDSVETQEIPALGHDYLLHKIAPNDAEKGLKYYTCNTCNNYFACVMDDSGKLSVGEEGTTLEDIKSSTLVIPTTEFNTYNRVESNYNYVNRCASLRLDDGGASDIQSMRFASSMLIPNGAEVKDYGYVYTQADLLTTLGKFVIGGNNIHDISLIGGNYSSFNTSKGTVRTFNLVISVNQSNWKTDYVARPYIVYTFAGEEYTIYDKCYSQRSVYGLAQSIIASPTENQSTKDFFQTKIIDALS